MAISPFLQHTDKNDEIPIFIKALEKPVVNTPGFCSKRGNYSEKQTFQSILLSYCQGYWHLHFRSAYGKQGNLSSKKKS